MKLIAVIGNRADFLPYIKCNNSEDVEFHHVSSREKAYGMIFDDYIVASPNFDIELLSLVLTRIRNNPSASTQSPTDDTVKPE